MKNEHITAAFNRIDFHNKALAVSIARISKRPEPTQATLSEISDVVLTQARLRRATDEFLAELKESLVD